MIKTYRANTSISMSVPLPSGKNLHVSFVSLSNGSSEYITKDVTLQQALEAHRWFNKMFRLVKSVDESEVQKPETPIVKEAAPLRKVSMTDLASAKDYLADTYGISRTSMRSRKNIVDQAAALGIEFEGI